MEPTVLPPLDGSIRVLPGFTDFHYSNNPDNTFFQFASNASNDVTKISFLEFARATHRVAHAVRPSGNDGEVVALIAACDTILYVPLLVGMVRAGFVPFPISPRNSPAAIYNMLEKTSCHHILSTSAFLQPLLDSLKQECASKNRVLKIHEIPTLAQIYPRLGNEIASDPFEPYASSSGWEPAMDDVVMYLHSSGSTGFPKSIPQTHRTILHWCSFPSMTASIYHPRPVIWGAMMLPSFHTLGIHSQLFAALISGVSAAVFPPQAPGPPLMPTPENTLEHCKKSGATAVVVIPAFLEVWAQSQASIDFLSQMELITFGGGPLSAESGDILVSNGVKITAAYGGTEFGAPTLTFDIHPETKTQGILKDPKDWAWMRFSERMRARWIDQGNGTFELHMLTNEKHQLSVENLPDVKGYATSDLWEKHPKIEGLWRIVGRADDVLVLAAGEKTVPAQMEGHILHHSMIQGTLMFGTGRNQVGLLVESSPRYRIDSKDEKAVIEFRNKIWPIVAESNRDAPAFSRIFKEMILVTDPAKPMMRASKGTVMRKATLALYADEIDVLYETVESSTKAQGVEPPTSWTAPDLIEWLSKNAEQINGERRIDPDDDIFEQGFDSLSATFLRNRIMGALRLSVDPTAKQALAGVTQNIVYVNPTIRQLASSVAYLVSPSGVNGREAEHLDLSTKAILAMVAKYSSDFPKSSNSTGVQSNNAIILLTGSTGSLGSYLLSALVENPNVKKVYAFSRKSKMGPSAERQKAAFEDKGLRVTPLSSEKVVFIEGDATQDKLGLAQSLYDEIHGCVTHIIHNAWRLDFNLSLSSFEPNIRATRGLIDFAMTSSSGRDLRFLFTSSIAVAQSWDKSQGPFPEEIVSKADTAVGNGYGEGKFVAEQLLAKASQYGLQSTCLRIGQICGGLPEGAWATSDWVPILVKSSIALGCLPDAQGFVSWIPMHIVTSTILDVAFGAERPPPALNIVHPRPVKWTTIMSAIVTALTSSVLDKPAPIPLLTFDQWTARLEASALKASSEDYKNIPAIKLLHFFRGLAAGDRAVREIGDQDIEAGGQASFAIDTLQSLSLSIRVLDSLNVADAHKWVEYWKRKDFI